MKRGPTLGRAGAPAARNEQAVTLNNLGKIQEQRGFFRDALEYYERALPILREVGDRPA